jgi:hypothetical protein
MLAVLVCVWWVRSYWWSDDLIVKLPNPQRQFVIHSMLGGTICYCNDYPPWAPAWTHKFWRFESDSVAAVTKDLHFSLSDNLFRFELFGPTLPPFSRRLVLPHWLIAATFAALVAAPWARHFRWRFSLRTLLITTTLVAVVLELVMVLRQ